MEQPSRRRGIDGVGPDRCGITSSGQNLVASRWLEVWTRASAICSVQRMPEGFIGSLIWFLQAPSTGPLAIGQPLTRYSCYSIRVRLRGSLAKPFRVLRTGQAALVSTLTDALDDLADLAEQDSQGSVEDPKPRLPGFPPRGTHRRPSRVSQTRASDPGSK